MSSRAGRGLTYPTMHAIAKHTVKVFSTKVRKKQSNITTSGLDHHPAVCIVDAGLPSATPTKTTGAWSISNTNIITDKQALSKTAQRAGVA